MFIRLDPGAGTPLFFQIAEAIRDSILAGRLPRDHRLPTVRDLASRLRVNPATVAAAYERLAAERLVTGRVGDGTFVAPLDEIRTRALRRRARERVDSLVETLVETARGAGIDEDNLVERLRSAMGRRAEDKKRSA